MDPILAAYDSLRADRKALDGRYADDASAKASLAQAMNNAATAANALEADKGNLLKDRSALVKLIQDTIDDGPPPPVA